MIVVTKHRPEALARLGVFVGEWVSGAWEKGLGGADWEHDFARTYRRAS